MTNPTLPGALARWISWHGLAVLAGCLAALWLNAPGWLSLVLGGSFVAGFVSNRASWEQAGRWGGPANGITALRLSLLLALGAAGEGLNEWWLGTGIALVAALDGLDGYVARRWQAGSLFGEYFDKETDNALVAMGGVLLIHSQGLGWWVLLPVGLRLGYVLLRRMLDPGKPEPRFRYGRIIAVVLMVAIPLSFVLPGNWQLACMTFAVGLVTFSFLKSYFWLIRQAWTA